MILGMLLGFALGCVVGAGLVAHWTQQALRESRQAVNRCNVALELLLKQESNTG